jgi:hypothetical protein
MHLQQTSSALNRKEKQIAAGRHALLGHTSANSVANNVIYKGMRYEMVEVSIY